MSEKQQRLVYSIIEFLTQSVEDGTVKTDDKESLEVAIQCIGEAFNVDPSNAEQVEKLSIKPATLQNIFDVFVKTRDNMGTSSAPSSATSSSQAKEPSQQEKEQAEKHKQTGNTLMSSKKYDEAITSYDNAIALDPTNPVYYSNRAAAYSSKGDHLVAIGDAEKALSIDQKFVKAYHRLGHAQYSLGDFQAAANAFENGLKLDPTNAALKSGLQNSQARITSSSSSNESLTPETPTQAAGAEPNLGNLASMLGGGGMPDLAGLMNNPRMRAMADQMAANGGLANLMRNPMFSNMMNRVQSGDMPSMQELMSDPTLRDLANQFGGGR